MKNSKIILVMGLTAMVASLGVYRQGRLDAADAAAPAKIGVVNVNQVLDNSAKHKKWQEKMKTEQEAKKAEFTKIKDELNALEANLKVRSAGSEDALRIQGELVEKKALLDAKEEFYRSKVETEMQQWTESLYQKMLVVVENVAKAKGLDMVIANESLDLPAPNLRDFLLTVKTKKLLYCNQRYDLTAEVLAAFDNAN